MSTKRHERLQCSHDGCGSRRISTGDDGFRYCDQGHRQSELGTIVAEDTGELPNHGKTSRRKDLDASSFTSRVSGFSGTKAFEHFLLCMQVVMRKQLRWLIDVQQFPEELEKTVVKDLWALQLQKLQSRASYDSETDTEAQRSEMFSSQSEGDSGTDAATLNSQHSKQASRKRPSGPSLIGLVCLDCIAAMLLKIPLTVADLHRWINGGELLYYRAAKEVPLSMRTHLPGHLQEQLEPQSLISPDTIHRNVMDALFSLQTDSGLAAPSINQPLVLYRWIRELSLPVEVFTAAQRLGCLLELDYSYSLSAKVGTTKSLRYPEIRLMALIVITTKLLFPFDGLKRYPKSPRDLNVLKMDWDSWVTVHEDMTASPSGRSAPEQLAFADAFSMTELDSINLGEDTLDQYLDWCEDNIASEEIRDRGKAGRDAEFRRALFEWFPTSAQSRGPSERLKSSNKGMTSDSRLPRVQKTLDPVRIVQEDGSDDIPRAGTGYMQHRSADELIGTSKTFFERASRVAGFSLQGMVRAVFGLEMQMMKREKSLSKRR